MEQLLDAVNAGDVDAQNRLVERIHEELRIIARAQLRGEYDRDVMLQTTLLVNEAYMKLFGSKAPNWKNRAHVFGSAKRAMRQFLVDWARKRKSAKREPGQALVTLGDWIPAAGSDVDILELDEALTKLAALNARQAEVVEYKCLLGMTNDEIARVLDVGVRTVVGDWTHAKAWLQVELG